MRFLQPSALLLALSVALFGASAWLVVLGSVHDVSLGRESLVVRRFYHGVAFEWHAAPPATTALPVPPRISGAWQWSALDPVDRRSKWVVKRMSRQGPTGSVEGMYVPFAWLIAASLAPSVVWCVIIARRPRRRATGACPNCAYDVRATPQRCPECGHELRPPKWSDHVFSFDVFWIGEQLQRRWRHRPEVPQVPPRVGPPKP